MKSLKKQLIAAIAMCLVAVVALSSATYAWFSMNGTVEATGMNVQAEAENGLVISNSAKTDWKSSAASSTTETQKLKPTSTADAATWYHNTSNDISSSTAAGEYTTVGSTTATQYYMTNQFYIKAAAPKAVKDTNLKITGVTVTPTGTATAELDKSLRILVKIGSNDAVILCPNGATGEYKVAGTTTVKPTDYSTITKYDNGVATGVTEIPASNGTPLDVKVYLYYEGEDANCKSANLAETVDSLNVAIKFAVPDADLTK